ncbi:universal stress protein [Streptomyces sp. NPDC023723]|uniref:universal stress protein n=1 Tax=Streptomyces sp. NPDC023723 TaxID=3154323 RepID=UPI0033C347FE
MRSPVVVGFDGSPSGLVAVETAAREAERLGTGLRLTYVLSWPSAYLPPGVPPWDPEGAESRGRVTGPLDEAERRARRTAPGIAVTQDVLIGEPVPVLESESRTASLTVVGSRPDTGAVGRLRGSVGRLRGSVARRLAAHGRCPVLVARGRPGPSGPVVLGDGTSPAAAEFAFAEAARRGADLVAPRPRVHAARFRTALRAKYPGVVVRDRRTRDLAGRALVEESAAAQLVVIGAGHGVVDMPRSWRARVLLNDARCPVAVVPAGRARP